MPAVPPAPGPARHDTFDRRAAPPNLPGLLTSGLRPHHRPGQHCDVLLGHVQALEGPGQAHIVAPGGRQLRAAVALSCPVQPEPGDLVQVVVQGMQAWITAILRRDAGSQAPGPAPAAPSGTHPGTHADPDRARRLAALPAAHAASTALSPTEGPFRVDAGRILVT